MIMAIQTRRVLFLQKVVVFEITEFSVPEAFTALIAHYYVFDVSYSKPPPASGVLLFIQELLMEMHEQKVKKSPHYSSLILLTQSWFQIFSSCYAFI